MKKTVLVLAMTSLMATNGWTAEVDESRGSKQERIGLGSGAVIGAVAAGPLGLIAGAVLGGWVGDRIHDEKSQRIDAEARYADAAADADRLEGLLAQTRNDLGRIASQLERERTAHSRALEEALNVQVYFRTAEASPEAGAVERLTRIGELIQPMDGVVVMLEGHADARGDADYNEALSQARAESVRQIFLDAGVPEERIAITAEGESRATAALEDRDALALDRRVEIRILGAEGPQRVAQRSAND